jgi:hypothetical protein
MGKVRIMGRALLAAIFTISALIAWAWWYYRPTIEFRR